MQKNNYIGTEENLKKYLEMGLKIIPLTFKSKIPLKGMKWKDFATSEESVFATLTNNLPAFNLGILTGEVNNIIVIDIDKNHNGFETLEKLEQKLGKLPDTVTVLSGGGGKHLYFKYPNEANIKGKANILGSGIDTRTDGNYIVAPPSVHPSGAQYQWEKNKAIYERNLADIPVEWVKALVEASTNTTTIPSASSSNITTIPKGTREETIFKFACSIRNKFQNISDVLMICQGINKQYCNPPLSDKEVENAVNSAWNYKSKPVIAPTIINLNDLSSMTFPEPNWIIQDFIPSGLHILAGKPKVGKSWFIMNLLTCISTSGKFLNKYVCNTKRGLYLALEDTGNRIQARLKKLNVNATNLSNISITFNFPNIKQGGLELLDKIISEQKYDIVVIDTLQCFRGPEILKNKNAYIEDYYILGEIKKLADKYNIAIIVVHHLNKNRTGNSFDNISRFKWHKWCLRHYVHFGR